MMYKFWLSRTPIRSICRFVSVFITYFCSVVMLLLLFWLLSLLTLYSFLSSYGIHTYKNVYIYVYIICGILLRNKERKKSNISIPHSDHTHKHILISFKTSSNIIIIYFTFITSSSIDSFHVDWNTTWQNELQLQR